MAGADVLGCLGAIVSAFHGAVGLVQTIKQRNDRRRRMNGVSQDAEEAFEEKMLLKSLSDGEAQCKSARDDKYRRYGTAFRAGDAEALAALKDVMVNLQMDIISALQVAQAVANAKLDASRLHEAAIMNKSAALRAIEELCKRLPTPSFEGNDGADVRSVRSNDNGEVRMTGVDRPLAVTVPTASPPSSPPVKPATPAPRPHRTQSQPVSQAKSSTEKSEKKRGGLARMFSNLGASLSMANDDYGSFARILQAERADTLREAEQQRKSSEPDDVARHAARDSGFCGSETSSRHVHTPSITSTLFSEDRRSSFALDSKAVEADGTPRSDSETIPSITVSPQPDTINSTAFARPSTSTIALSRPDTAIPITQWEEDDEVMRATLAPEVVTPGFESMLPYRPSSRSGVASGQESVTSLRGVHPAFRDAWPIDPRASPSDQDIEWAPHRPAKLNQYYNFCKGAWQIRERIEEGISIVTVSSNNSGSGAVPYWKCKQCEFRSKALNHSAGSSRTALPDHLYILPTGVRYRWLFLAKSHLRAETSQTKIEAYAYGCIFCAAEGRETAVHASLDALMGHIAAKHKTSMMTPEVREKTKCVIGGEPEDDDWDIDLPESSKRGRIGGLFGR